MGQSEVMNFNEGTSMAAVIAICVLVSASVLFVISVRWTTKKGAPWEPTTMAMVGTMLEMAEVGPNDIVYDLGCGDGRIPIMAARKYGARAIGIEIDPLRFVWCWLLVRILGLDNQVEIRFGDIFQQDMSDATVVTCYLLQDTNDRLASKFHQELSPGTRVVSNTHTFHHLSPVMEKENAQLFIFNPVVGEG